MISAARVYQMLGKDSLWDAAHTTHVLLQQAGLPHALIGGVAVCLHGYQRNTVDVDLLVRREDASQIRAVLEAAGWKWIDDRTELQSPTGVVLQFLMSGEKAGPGSAVRLPDPADEKAVTTVEGLPVLTLARLIEAKIACGEGSLRRTHKDFADVVELIAAHDLSREFARYLHPSLRPTFRELVLHARDQRA